ncbi:TonB-dependent receptor [uncultured Desulfobacter sp.]|uniref:TonB-dependent receptor n=1 Tax=uncultured Desulfobacter sp. TaxID=240139 RepID=UPI002AA5FA77|nr:TonB-dependent receptor [uncultured Desulfobacter sp.]
MKPLNLAQFHLLIIAILLPVFSMARPGLAQIPKEASQIIDDVVVTAEKRKQMLKEVPVSITVIDDLEIQDRNVRDVKDIFNLVPNLSVSSQNQNVTYVGCRGVSPSMINRRNPFVMYVDGVPFSKISGYSADFTNVESVELLRGPQGTLYGKNAMGGVMNITTKAPSNDLEGRVSLDISEYETYLFNANVSGPIKKNTLFFGLWASEYQTRGYMENDHPDQDYYDDRNILNVRGRLRWVPSEQLEINLLSGKEIRQGGDGPMIGDSQIRFHEYKNPDDYVDADSFDNALHARFHAKKFDIVSTTTYRNATEDYDVDYSYGSSSVSHGILDYENTTFSHELRLQSPDDRDGIAWIAGGYFEYDQDKDNEMSMQYLPTAMMNFNRKTDWPCTTTGKTAAVFAQTSIPFFNAFKFTIGARYEIVNKEMNYHRTTTNLDTNTVVSSAAYTIEDDWDSFTPKASLDYRISDNIMTYVSVSQGYLAGGFNNTIDDPDATTYDPQTSTSYEWGAKTSWLNNRLSCNLSIFYMDIKDMQVTEYPSAYVMVASNAGKAHSYGGELEVKFRPVTGLILSTGLGLVQGEYDEYMGYGGEAYAGNKLKNTPEYSINAAIQYRHPSGIYTGLDVQGYGKTYFNESNQDNSVRDPYAVVNLKLGLELSHWDFYVYAKNLFDEEYYTSIFTSSIRNSYMVGSPRTIGANIVFRF